MRAAALASLLLLLAAPSRAAHRETLFRQAGRMLLVGAPGDSVETGGEFERLICGLKVGGVILFDHGSASGAARNIVSKEQLQMLTEDLQALAKRCGDWPLLIAADVEGGQVNRMSTVEGLRRLKSHSELGKEGKKATYEYARHIGEVMAATGVRWDLAPVVDLALNPDNPIISKLGRAFSDDPGAVAEHAAAFALGLRKEGVLNCIKHFPGHGSSSGDTHLRRVDVTQTADLLQELWPYKELIRTGLADCVMTAHVLNDDIDPEHAVTLSSSAVDGLLREDLGYDGLVLTDDLQMGAVARRYGAPRAAVMAVNAGADMLTIANNTGDYDKTTAFKVHQEIIEAVREGRIHPSRMREANRRIRLLKSRLEPSL